MSKRRVTKAVNIGGVKVGGGADVTVQSMTKTDTRDVAVTVRQIHELDMRLEGRELADVGGVAQTDRVQQDAERDILARQLGADAVHAVASHRAEIDLRQRPAPSMAKVGCGYGSGRLRGRCTHDPA